MRRGLKEKRLKDNPKINVLVEYIASGNPNGVRQLAYKYGYPGYKTYQGSVRFLHQFLKTEGEKGLDDLIMQHPDLDIILDVHSSRNPQRLEFSSFADTEKKESAGKQNSEEEQSLLNTLGVLIAKRKDQLLKILAKHGEEVSNKEDVKELSDKVIKLVYKGEESFNYDLAGEISELQNNGSSEFAPIVGAIAKGIGKVAGNLKIGKKSNDNSSAVSLAALNYRMNNNQQKQNQEDQKKDNTSLIIGLGIASSVIILVIIILLISK